MSVQRPQRRKNKQMEEPECDLTQHDSVAIVQILVLLLMPLLFASPVCCLFVHKLWPKFQNARSRKGRAVRKTFSEGIVHILGTCEASVLSCFLYIYCNDLELMLEVDCGKDFSVITASGVWRVQGCTAGLHLYVQDLCGR